MTFLAALTGVAWLFWPLMVLTLWSIYFFRDPPRGVPQDDGVLIAPADGLVQMVAEAVPPAELGLGEQPLIARLDLPQRVRRPHQPLALRRPPSTSWPIVPASS